MEVTPFIGNAQPPSDNQPEKAKKIRRCPHCGQLREIKDPWKELFRWPTFQEWITLFIIVMVLFVAWSYKHDIQVCKDFIANGTSMCVQQDQPNYTAFTHPDLNLSLIIISNSSQNNISENILNDTAMANETISNLNLSNDT